MAVVVELSEAEQARAAQLRRARIRASGLLGVVSAIFVLTALFGHAATWAGYVRTGAEASMVGGLADWFAVTALFRRPLGLPIPHTAIVVERKDAFGATLGSFIQESLLTPQAITERVRSAHLVDRAAAWLAEPSHAERLARQALDGLSTLADLWNEDEIHRVIERLVGEAIDGLPLAPLAGRALQRVFAAGQQSELVDNALQALHRWLDTHREELQARLKGQVAWWLPAPIEQRILERLVDRVTTVVGEMVGHPDHPLREQLQGGLDKLARDLQTSPELAKKAEQVKRDLLAQPDLRAWAASLWEGIRSGLASRPEAGASEWQARLGAVLQGIGDRLASDEELRAAADQGLAQAATFVTDRFHGEIAGLVTNTVTRWDGREAARRLELLLGPDLQFIRINGCVVGAAVGLVLHAVAVLLAHPGI